MMKAMLTTVALLLASQDRFRGAGPEVGKDAPNFTAKVLGGEGKVELKAALDKEKKPVVLIFGSYT